MADRLQRAIAAIRADDKETGKRLLVEVIRDDPRHETAWLWMSSVLDSDAERRFCLERVLAINPGNQLARQGLEALGAKQAPEPPKTPQESEPLPTTAVTPLERIIRMQQEATRRCPFCAETIKAEAVVCRFCNRDLIARRPMAPTPPAPRADSPSARKERAIPVTLLAAVGLIAIISFAGCILLTLFNTPTNMLSTFATPAPAVVHTLPAMTPSPTLTLTPAPTLTPTPGLSPEELEYVKTVQEALHATNLAWENTQRLIGQLKDDYDYWSADPDWHVQVAANLLVPSVYYTKLRDKVSVPPAFTDAHKDLLAGWEHWDRAAKLALEGTNLWTQGEDDQGKVAASASEVEQGQAAVMRGIQEIERVQASRPAPRSGR
jgi:hypothetical protein